MLLWLTEEAVILCDHATGKVTLEPRQDWVTIAGQSVLVADDPQGRKIAGCSNINVPGGILPCRTTLRVQAGYSTFISIDGNAVCLETITGATDGTPQGAYKYTVKTPGQDWIRGAS